MAEAFLGPTKKVSASDYIFQSIVFLYILLSFMIRTKFLSGSPSVIALTITFSSSRLLFFHRTPYGLARRSIENKLPVGNDNGAVNQQ